MILRRRGGGDEVYFVYIADALTLQMTFSSDTFKEIASGWIASGQVKLYYRHFYFDNFHPIWYSIFLS